jgi:hypothetical protein
MAVQKPRRRYQLLAMTQDNYPDVRKQQEQATALTDTLKGGAALLNGMTWMGEVVGLDVGFWTTDEVSRLDRFRMLHKDDGTGTTTEKKPE